jgi:4-hydroxy-2-oxoheptanedioate aldolase
MRTNHVKRRLKAGEPSIGTWLALPSPESAEFVANLGLDWLVVDAEHNSVDSRTLAQMFTAMAHFPVAPTVRIPTNTTENIKRALDQGAWGIVVPNVKSRAEAEAAVQATRYTPLGERGVGGGRHYLSFETSAPEYYKAANDEILLVVMIEHITGVENADAILSTPGIDACFIGPNDLAASMGLGLGVPLESDFPAHNEAINHVLQTCKKHGVAPGIHTSGAAGVNQRIAEGFQFCALASELRYMLGGLRDDIGKLNWQRSVATGGEGAIVRY